VPVTDMPLRDQRKNLSEMVRLAERKWAACDDNASRLEEGRSILMAEMKLNLLDSGAASSLARAEDMARASQEWRGYVRKMHDARREANDARADWRALERDYWSTVSDEASERQQMRLAR
jgi:hypothetical protein